MQSETQPVRKDSSAHQSALKVRDHTAIGESVSFVDDFKIFRIAVVIGLVMVGGLSVFLPDQAGRPTYEAMAPASLESLDLAQHTSTDSARTQTNIVELRQGKETAGQTEIRATLAPVVPSSEVVKRQAMTSKANPVVRTPPFQTHAVFLQR